MKDPEGSNPIEVAEDAIANKLQRGASLKCWVGHALQKRGWIRSAVDAWIKKTTHEV